jgi:hypothetical protein
MTDNESAAGTTPDPGGGFVNDQPEPEEPEPAADQPELSRSDRWAALFWLGLGVALIGFVLPTAGLQLQLLAPAAVLVFYGLFVLWNPEIASTDAPWTGFLWIALGIVTLIVLQVIDLYWPYHITGIIIGFFLLFAGFLVVLDL